MSSELSSTLASLAKWLNENQGVLTALLFVATGFLGWVSGIFASLLKKPRLALVFLEGPTFYSTFITGKEHKGHEAHRSAFCLYLKITNIGAVPTNIDRIRLAYHWNVNPLSKSGLKYWFGWFWLEEETVALDDFQAAIGGKIKVFPFLKQRSSLGQSAPKTYLQVGEATNGVVYFEQPESWGGSFPYSRKGKASIKVCLLDSFGNEYCFNAKLEYKTLEQAKRYNPSFGTTFSELHRDADSVIDRLPLPRPKKPEQS